MEDKKSDKTIIIGDESVSPSFGLSPTGPVKDYFIKPENPYYTYNECMLCGVRLPIRIWHNCSGMPKQLCFDISRCDVCEERMKEAFILLEARDDSDEMHILIIHEMLFKQEFGNIDVDKTRKVLLVSPGTCQRISTKYKMETQH